jgi:hypothetical protein
MARSYFKGFLNTTTLVSATEDSGFGTLAFVHPTHDEWFETWAALQAIQDSSPDPDTFPLPLGSLFFQLYPFGIGIIDYASHPLN